jgi:HD-GYP domain-containing protein (c-di-GMP phosphodiesterase class II)
MFNSVTVEVSQVRCGMFVTALDRPWNQTPFLFQGFLIEDPNDIVTLRDVCAWVTVDPSRSRGDALTGLALDAAMPPPEPPRDRRVTPRVRPKPLPPPRRPGRGEAPGAGRAPAGGPDAIDFQSVTYERPDAREARRQRARGIVERVKRKATPLPAEQRPPEVPRDVALVRYDDESIPLAQELPRARVVAQAAREALAHLARDIVDKGELQLQEVEATANDLTESIVDNPNALLWLVRVREQDASTYMHGVKVAVYLLMLGRHLGYPPDRLAELATTGLLLDVGKLFVDAALLRKAGPLSEDEFFKVQRHVDLGLEALTRAGALPTGVYDGIAQHHERMDGSGYPRRLAGNAITIEGRMAAIADSFAAMTSPRPYAQPMSAYQAMRTLFSLSGRCFQESLVEKFVQAVGIFPTGALVELNTGEIAVVIRHNRERRLEPRVLVLTGVDRKPLAAPQELDLMMQKQLALEHGWRRIRQGLPVGAYGLDVSQFYLG